MDKNYGYYKGKPLSEMTRDELMDAVIELGHLYENLLEQNLKSIPAIEDPKRNRIVRLSYEKNSTAELRQLKRKVNEIIDHLNGKQPLA
jgi:hypothetical protein